MWHVATQIRCGFSKSNGLYDASEVDTGLISRQSSNTAATPPDEGLSSSTFPLQCPQKDSSHHVRWYRKARWSYDWHFLHSPSFFRSLYTPRRAWHGRLGSVGPSAFLASTLSYANCPLFSLSRYVLLCLSSFWSCNVSHNLMGTVYRAYTHLLAVLWSPQRRLGVGIQDSCEL